MKELKIKNGKFTLDEKVVEVELIELKIVEHIISRDTELKDSIYSYKPEGASAYVVGGNSYLSTPDGFERESLLVRHYPILYLRIKEKK